MIINNSLTYKEILEQAMNVVFFNWLFAPDDDAIPGITNDLEAVLKVYFRGFDVKLVVNTNGLGDLIAKVSLYDNKEFIEVHGELQVQP